MTGIIDTGKTMILNLGTGTTTRKITPNKIVAWQIHCPNF